MSDRAQRVLDALMEYDNKFILDYPIEVISDFVKNVINSENPNFDLEEDYQALSIDEEKQVIKAFLEFAC